MIFVFFETKCTLDAIMATCQKYRQLPDPTYEINIMRKTYRPDADGNRPFIRPARIEPLPSAHNIQACTYTHFPSRFQSVKIFQSVLIQKTSDTYKSTPTHKTRTPTHLSTSLFSPLSPPLSPSPPIPHPHSLPSNTKSLPSPLPPSPHALLPQCGPRPRPQPLQTLHHHNDTTPSTTPHNTTPTPRLRSYANNMLHIHLLPPRLPSPQS
jgi:hypothetical protein